jgi:hypothetical protein
MRCHSVGTQIALLMALLGGVVAPCFAEHWVEIGKSGAAADTLLVDGDSLRMRDGFRVVDIMTRYAAPRAISHNVTFDRIVQTTAFDCKKRSYSLIHTVGYLGEQRFGSGKDLEGWQEHMSSLPGDSLTRRIFGIVCPDVVPDAPAAPPQP